VRRLPLRALGLLAVTAGVALALAPTGTASPPPAPWQAYQQLDEGLFDVQLATTLGDAAKRRAGVAASVAAARRLAADLDRATPGAGAAVRARVARVASLPARTTPSQVALAVTRVRTAVLSASYRATVAATGRGDAGTAEQWALVRSFEQVTRYTHPSAAASVALASLRDGVVSPARARTAVRLDLLDTYESLLRASLATAGDATRSGSAARATEAAADAQGYWGIVRDAFASQRGAVAARSVDGRFDALVGAAVAGRAAATQHLVETIRSDLVSFRAAPLPAAEQARKAGQLLRFLGLVPIEYARGVSNGVVTVPIEIQEAITFRDGAADAFGDLQSYLARNDAGATLAAQRSLDRLQVLLGDSGRGMAIAPPSEIKAVVQHGLDSLGSAYPDAWKGDNTQADFDVIATLLQKVTAAAASGDYRRAESSRLEAYATFELGPEQHLRGLAPSLFQRVEGLFWYGAGGKDGLAQLVRRNASSQELAATMTALDLALRESAEAIGEGASRPTVILNTAIITFREGLEAVLILAALMASMVGAQRRYRRPLLAGASLALLGSATTWVVAQTVLRSLSRYGERLEAIVSLVAIGVLLLILNWFYHRVYWQENLQGLHRKKKSILSNAGLSLAAAQVAGLVALGFTSVYREGFETTLFVQALSLEAGAWTVLQGIAIGLAATLAVGVVVVSLERKLPHKKMLMATGLMITWVLVVLVGQTVQVLQKVGWAPVSPVSELRLPYWSGVWLGVYPTWEGLLAQAGAATVVIGSYVLYEAIRRRRRAALLSKHAVPVDPATAGASPRREAAQTSS
jgi:high-affinity iron transporter